MKEILKLVTGLADVIIGLSIDVYGVYLFFIERDFLSGALVFGCGALWSIAIILNNRLAKSKTV